MKPCVLLCLFLLLGCGDSDTTKKSLPGYLVVPAPVETIDEKPELRHKIPDGIPLALAKVYADLQDSLTEEQFQSFLKQMKRYCDGYVDHNLLKLRIRLWFPESELSVYRIPKFNRSLTGRQSAYFSWHVGGHIEGGEKFNVREVADDKLLSKMNKIKAYGHDVYDCVEGY